MAVVFSDAPASPTKQAFRPQAFTTHRDELGVQPMNSPKPSATDLQSHLYTSFLEARTADVTLRVRGSWSAVYKLHRVVLIQSGYFSSLFTAGFLESSPRSIGFQSHPEEIDITFDDRNITRAAFEICIARLYGGGPVLYVPPDLIPTSTYPLTPCFPTCYPDLSPSTPAGYHLASPTFLLSLLATSIYLSIPSTACQALNLILGSVGPRTVVEYLNFALGKGILEDYDWAVSPATGLENVAQEVQHQSHEGLESTKGSLEDVVSNLALNDVTSQPSESGNPEPCFDYGSISKKIGEATACWLARWGTDILAHEQNSVTKGKGQASEVPSLRRRNPRRLPSEIIDPALEIFSRGGLSPAWISAVVSSDALFVKNEKERYEFARNIVEMRRRQNSQGESLDEEEAVWAQMFTSGIYYANMSTDDLIYISQDKSPSTGKSYVPRSILQTMHWGQSVLRHQIMAKSPSPPPSSPSVLGTPTAPPDQKILGLALSGAQILAGDLEHPQYYPVPADSSMRLGDGGNIEPPATMDQLFEVTSASSDSKGLKGSVTESNFFGLMQEGYVPTSSPTSKNASQDYTTFPPIRFGVEFFDVDLLKEKSRLHSHTIWYAGSLFNVYVQMVRKKEKDKGSVQLGVYLHRQSSIDPIPPASAPSPVQVPTTTRFDRSAISPTRPTSGIPISSSSLSFRPTSAPRSATPASAHGHSPSPSFSTSPTVSSPISNNPPPYSSLTVPTTASRMTPLQPYRDPRASISAYFTISCASATGSSLTRFTSAPDKFSVSQSWGWKSSSLRTEEYLYLEGDEKSGQERKRGNPEISLRATVVLGIV